MLNLVRYKTLSTNISKYRQVTNRIIYSRVAFSYKKFKNSNAQQYYSPIETFVQPTVPSQSLVITRYQIKFSSCKKQQYRAV